MRPVFFLLGLILMAAASNVPAAERDPLTPRVPTDKMEEVVKQKNPFPASRENLAKGRSIYEGKGSCFTCHGLEGKGDGPAAVGLDPSPRNFTNLAFHAARTDGELLYVLKHGSPGTAMMPLVGSAITEEEAWLVLIYVRAFGKNEVSPKRK